jgi:hypothetical protein
MEGIVQEKGFREQKIGDCKISAPKYKTRFRRVFDMIVRIQPPARHAARSAALGGGPSQGGEGVKISHATANLICTIHYDQKREFSDLVAIVLGADY